MKKVKPIAIENPAIESVCFCYDSSEVKKDDIHAQFPGGYDSLNRFIEANRQAINEPIEKELAALEITVYLNIGKDGCISDIKCDTTYYPRHTAEAVRIAKLMPCWIPPFYIDKNGKRIPVEDTWLRSINVIFNNEDYMQKR